MALDIVKMIEDPNSQVLIETPTALIKGFLNFEFALTGNAEWGELIPSNAAADALFNIFNLGVAAINPIVGTNWSQRQAKAFGQTTSSYQGSTKLQFTIPLLFVALDAEDDVRDPAYRLMEGVLPSSDGFRADDIPIAPFGYAPLSKEKAGVVNIKIGKWMVIPELVIRSVTVVFSKELIGITQVSGDNISSKELGKPLYSKVDVTFETVKLLSAKQFKDLFYDLKTSRYTTDKSKQGSQSKANQSQRVSNVTETGTVPSIDMSQFGLWEKR